MGDRPAGPHRGAAGPAVRVAPGTLTTAGARRGILPLMVPDSTEFHTASAETRYSRGRRDGGVLPAVRAAAHGWIVAPAANRRSSTRSSGYRPTRHRGGVIPGSGGSNPASRSATQGTSTTSWSPDLCIATNSVSGSMVSMSRPHVVRLWNASAACLRNSWNDATKTSRLSRWFASS